MEINTDIIDTNGKNGNAAEEQSSDDLQPNQKHWTGESEDENKEYEVCFELKLFGIIFVFQTLKIFWNLEQNLIKIINEADSTHPGCSEKK